MSKLPPSSPISHKIAVGTVAVFAGVYAFWQTGKDFQFIKYVPRTEEEIEKRKKEGLGFKIKHLETRTLDYTPEAKQRMKQEFDEWNAEKENKEAPTSE